MGKKKPAVQGEEAWLVAGQLVIIMGIATMLIYAPMYIPLLLVAILLITMSTWAPGVWNGK